MSPEYRYTNRYTKTFVACTIIIYIKGNLNYLFKVLLTTWNCILFNRKNRITESLGGV